MHGKSRSLYGAKTKLVLEALVGQPLVVRTKDNPLTHDYSVSGCTSLEAEVLFPSDWNIEVRPMAPYGSLLTFQQSYLEIEFEAYYAHALFAGFG